MTAIRAGLHMRSCHLPYDCQDNGTYSRHQQQLLWEPSQLLVDLICEDGKETEVDEMRGVVWLRIQRQGEKAELIGMLAVPRSLLAVAPERSVGHEMLTL